MTRGTLLVGGFVTVFAASALPALAQRTPTGSGQSTGSAVSRDSGSSSGGDSGSASSGSSSSSAPSGGASSSAPSSGSGGRERSEYYVAPSRPSERQQSRERGEGQSRRGSGGSEDSGRRAVPRDGSGSAPAGDTSRGASAARGGDDEAPSRRAVPTHSRPREGRPATGTAVRRPDAPFGGGGISSYPFGYYGSYYRSPYRLYYVPGGYGFGLGYLYDPYLYDPYGFDSYGYAGGGGGGYYGGSGRSSYSEAPTGSLRLKIKPREARVYIDGYFVGDVDDFDGVFQKLGIDAGGHRIEIRAEGYETIAFDVLVTAGETVTYKGDLKRQ